MGYTDTNQGCQGEEEKDVTITVMCCVQNERTYCCLSSDMGTAYYLRPSQWFLPLGPLPQGDQGRHVWE